MKRLDSRNQPLRASGSGLWILLALFAAGCSDKTLPSQPLTPTPTPRPAPGPTTISFTATLARTEPPAGVKHAALATVVVKETGGRSVSLTGMKASSYYGFDEMRVVGFVPVQLAAGQTVTFTVTLTTQADIACAAGVDLSISIADEVTADGFIACAAPSDWPF
jgi:hypothetical protein